MSKNPNSCIYWPLTPTPDLVEFTDEESYGKFLDLHQLYDRYINLKGVEKTDYLSYLGTFDRLFEIPRDKKSSEYKKWVITVATPVITAPPLLRLPL